MGLRRTLRKLETAYLTLLEMNSNLRSLRFMVSHAHYETALATFPRYQDPRHLARCGEKVYSQNEEDGILREIFRRIGPGRRFFVEFGVGNGMENNTLALLLEGWDGVWIEAKDRFVAQIRESFAELIRRKQLRFQEAMVTAENIESLFAALEVPEEPDLLSIDIDGNDYWIWKAISRCRPRVVAIEYNASLGSSADVKQPYDPAFRWNHNRAYSASLKALENLGRAKGYALVGCNFNGSNAFFVREDLVGDHFLPPFTAEAHFEPPRYFLKLFPGHPVSHEEIPAFFHHRDGTPSRD